MRWWQDPATADEAAKANVVVRCSAPSLHCPMRPRGQRRRSVPWEPCGPRLRRLRLPHEKTAGCGSPKDSQVCTEMLIVVIAASRISSPIVRIHTAIDVRMGASVPFGMQIHRMPYSKMPPP